MPVETRRNNLRFSLNILKSKLREGVSSENPRSHAHSSRTYVEETTLADKLTHEPYTVERLVEARLFDTETGWIEMRRTIASFPTTDTARRNRQLDSESFREVLALLLAEGLIQGSPVRPSPQAGETIAQVVDVDGVPFVVESYQIACETPSTPRSSWPETFGRRTARTPAHRPERNWPCWKHCSP